MTFIWCSLIHFSLSAIHFKAGCRQSKVNRLFNLFSLCLYTLSCEIAEQPPRQYRDFVNIQRAHLPAECHSCPLHLCHFFVVHVCASNCVNFCSVQEVLPAHTNIQSVILDLVEQMLYRLDKGVLKAWHITWLCTTSDSNHTWPRSTTPIILWICYGVLMLSVYPGFIIMTPVPHKGSADPARGLDVKQTKLPCQTLHRGQGQEAIQF